MESNCSVSLTIRSLILCAFACRARLNIERIRKCLILLLYFYLLLIVCCEGKQIVGELLTSSLYLVFYLLEVGCWLLCACLMIPCKQLVNHFVCHILDIRFLWFHLVATLSPISLLLLSPQTASLLPNR